MSNTIAQNLQRLIDAKDAISAAITAKGGTVSAGDGFEDFAADISAIPSGGGGGGRSTILSGTTDPSSNIGYEGDIYLKTSNTVVESVTFSRPVKMQLDYYCNENSVIEFDCALPAPTNSYDTPLGSRGDTDFFIAYDGGILRYSYAGATGNVGDISSYYDQRIKITLSRTYCKVERNDVEIYNTTFSGATSTSTVKLGLCSLFTNNSGGYTAACDSDCTVYGLKIYENGDVVRDYVPFIDGSTYCIKETISGALFMPLQGSLTGITTTGTVYNVIDSFLKVNDAWQSLMRSDINDVNTAGAVVTDYDTLTNKPSINTVTLSGNKTNADLGIQTCLYDNQTDEVYTIVDGARVVLATNVKAQPMIPVMTSVNYPEGLVESGGYYGYGTYGTQDKWNAFDSNDATYVCYQQENVQDGWISYAFASDKSVYVTRIVAKLGNYQSANSIAATLYVYDEDDTEIEIATTNITGYATPNFGTYEFQIGRVIKKLKFVFGGKTSNTNVMTYDVQAYGWLVE